MATFGILKGGRGTRWYAKLIQKGGTYGANRYQTWDMKTHEKCGKKKVLNARVPHSWKFYNAARANTLHDYLTKIGR